MLTTGRPPRLLVSDSGELPGRVARGSVYHRKMACRAAVSTRICRFKLAVLAIHYYVVPPLNSFTLKNNLFSLGVAELPRLILFSIAALFVTFLSSAQRAAAESLRRSRDDLLAATGSAAQLRQRGPLFRGPFVLPGSVRYEGHGSKTEFAESSLLVESTRSLLFPSRAGKLADNTAAQRTY